MIEKIRASQTIGIISGTLAVQDYLNTLNFLSQLIRSSAKRCYTLVVGQLNPSKLANFPDVDAFVLVSCPENSLLDNSRDFLAPLVTPLEIFLALLPAQFPWTGAYSVDFTDISRPSIESFLPSSFDVPDSTGSTLIHFNPTTHQLINHPSPSTSSFQSFSGLDPQIGQTPVSLASIGSSGIASSYDTEPKK